jgi:hypothetical protein
LVSDPNNSIWALTPKTQIALKVHNSATKTAL